MGEAELLVGFAAGEAGSVTEMYRSYGRLVYAVCYRVLGDAGPAEEATRQTFRQAWKLAPSVDPEADLGPWLATIAPRTAMGLRRDRQHSDRRPDRQRPDQQRPDRQHGALAPGGREPGDRITSAEQIHDVWRVRRALDQLSDQDRELIRLHHRRLTATEIADRLAIPLASVRSRSQHAHRRLALLLGSLAAATSPCG